MLSLPGYKILAKIHESDSSIVYRGRQKSPDLPVILKLLKSDYPTQEELDRYKKEFTILQSFNLEGVVKAYSLEPYANTLVMILEDFGGESLKIWMKSQRFTLLGFLNLAIKMVEGIGEIHAKNIIHKDINPSNLVFNTITGQLKFIDFGIAHIVSSDSNSSDKPAGLEGTLAYLSPEQTGRMNRTLDYRTDFYSLGITFYELLTHQLPFQSNDAMELVHAHIAKQPQPLYDINPEIPIALSDIVMKLLSKTAEDRYQSSYGLRADLDNCLNQLQTAGNIEQFELGSQDISDQFQIPQKLYGRETEISTLLSAFERVSQGHTEMMLVLGYSGIGKSALVQVLNKPITQKQGYFIWGKFDQLQRSIPYSAVVSAFSELVRQLLTESESKLERWREKLQAALGKNGRIIIEVIPEIELILGSQPPVQELGPIESQNRFNRVFQNFIRVFCQPEHPLVIFLDDLQWADSATLKLIELMMSDSETQFLFLIGAYRDNEVSPTHPLMMMLDGLRGEIEIEKLEVTINQISLPPLGLEQIIQLIAETLHSDRTQVKSLAELVLRKTEGNPFFIKEFLKTLYQENLLTFTPSQAGQMGGWQWDIPQIESVAITENVVDLMINKMKKLPESTQEVLRLVACLGNQFDLNTLSLIHEQESSETFQHLLPAIRLGLISPASEWDSKKIEIPLAILNYKFPHDRVQQAAYALIDEQQKKEVHLKIGRLLLANTPHEYRSERIFDLVDNLNLGRSLITQYQELYELAELNLEAAKKAKAATAYIAAKQYLMAGMEELTETVWTESYSLALSLYKERAEVEYLNGCFTESEKYIHQILVHAQEVFSKAEVYKMLIVQYSLQAKYLEAVDAGKTALSLLGIDLPETDLQTAIGAEFSETQQNLAHRDIATLIELPQMVDLEKRYTLELLINFLTPAYLTNQQLWVFSVLKGVNLSLKYGSAPESCLCYSNYGMLLTSFTGDYKSAYEFGRLALNLTEKWNSLSMMCKACASLANALNYWFHPIKESNVINNKGYQAALDSGDLEYAGYLLHNKINNFFFQGRNIAKVLEEIEQYLVFTEKTNNMLSTDTLLGYKLILNDLLDNRLEGLEEGSYLAECQAHQNFYSFSVYAVHKIYLNYLYGDLQAAATWVTTAEEKIAFITGTVPATEFNFYSSLVWLGLAAEAEESQQQQYLEKVATNQNTLKTWADNSPDNFLHQYELVEAEKARIFGNMEAAMQHYETAIALAKQNEFIHAEALANELTAQFWLGKNKPKYAEVHLRDAYYAYQRWGAFKKVEKIEETHPQIIAKAIKTRFDNPLIASTHTSAGGRIIALDLASVLKASQAISGEIVLDKLLASLMKILIENAGAQAGFLILPRDKKLVVATSASVTAEEVILQQSIPVEEYPNLPKTLIYYVERTRKDVVLNNAASEGRFTTDPYIVTQNLKSVLCTPILNQGNLIGILYLENNLTLGAFTPERIEILKVLSSQAAISLENALLYASMEQKVQQRTQELNEKNRHLEQTLHELQRTQAQLIQTEKMSSLGQMVAGVAHEINNPVSFIYGNLSPADEYVQDLLSLIRLYQKNYPNPVEEVQAEIDAIDLEFLANDLQKLLDSMKVGAERIRNIVLSLRNFSRLDEAEMKPVDIHDGIESTLMLLQPRLREGAEQYGIEVVKEYGQLPKVVCYTSQLNQVFMNILSNAIDALGTIRDKQQPTLKKPQIKIHTEVDAQGSTFIRITDNGSGMPEEVLYRIFDPFFTTKPVGSGTGLGLSISYQIVVERHKGNLSCLSTPKEGTEFIVEIPALSCS